MTTNTTTEITTEITTEVTINTPIEITEVTANNALIEITETTTEIISIIAPDKNKLTKHEEYCVAAKQHFKCANHPNSKLLKLEHFDCPLYKNNINRGNFDELAYVIDFDLNKKNIALCPYCYCFKEEKQIDKFEKKRDKNKLEINNNIHVGDNFNLSGLSYDNKLYIAAKQYFKCAIFQCSEVDVYNDNACPLYYDNSIYFRNIGNFNLSGYRICCIDEFIINKKENFDNLQAFCETCYMINICCKDYVKMKSKIKCCH
jgi:hypothetical protein